MILDCHDLKVEWGDEVLFDRVSFLVREHEHIAIVGPNGCGKTTLLSVIMGELRPSDGTVTRSSDVTVGYLKQYQEDLLDTTIHDHVLHARQDILDMEEELTQMEDSFEGLSEEKLHDAMEKYHSKMHEFDLMEGHSYRSKVVGVLKGLGFCEDDFDKPVERLSGGEKTRVNLAKLLITEPDLLLLDEPINHLDMKSIEWLEGYLSDYKGALLIVAHDRYFLDKVANTIIDLNFHTGKVYKGNYTEFCRQKDEWLLTMEREYENQQRLIAHEEAVIKKLRQFNREKSIKRAESRVKRLQKIQRIEKVKADDTDMHLTLTPRLTSGKDVLEVEGLSKSFGERTLFSGLDFEIHRGEHVAIIGENGTGKTTILKVLNDRIPADAGKVRLGTNVTIAYYDQEQQELSDNKTLYDEVSDAYPDMTETEVRNVLAAFLFTDDEVFMPISTLSGGERGRVSLAKLMLSGANFLILDEPTNHLDMESKEILENAINSYEGTVLYVSHDRYFINQTAERLLELRDEGLYNYIGDYDYYLSKRDEAVYQNGHGNAKSVSDMTGIKTSFDNPESDSQSVSERPLSGREDYENQKRLAAEKKKKEREIAAVEAEIEDLEARIADIDEQFLDPDTSKNSARLNELTAIQTELKAQLDEKYELWDSLNA